MTTTYHVDFVFGRTAIVQVEVRDDHVSIALWSLDCAREILSDKQRLAAEYEGDGDLADRDGRVSDGAIYRANASELLTQAHDLFAALNGASGCLSDGKRAA